MIEAIVIRPEPGCTQSLSALNDLDIPALGFPLFEVKPLPWEMVEPDNFDALLIGSANALRHGGAGLSAYRGKLAYAVGEVAAQAARDAGLDVIATGTRGLQSVLELIEPGHRTLLRLAGQTRTDLIPRAGTTIVERIVYASTAQPMPADLATRLRKPAVVLLHSAEAARHFAACCDGKAIERSQIALATIAKRVANAAGHGWSSAQWVESPEERALLALAGRMCQNAAGPKDKDTSAMDAQTHNNADQSPNYAAAIPPPARRKSVRGQLLVILLAFVLGAAAVGWLNWRGYLDGWSQQGEIGTAQPNDTPGTQLDLPATDEPDGIAELESVTTVEARLAMLEDRFSRINLQANAASGNAARAEGLLIAFAARRMVDRGEPLRYLDDQLRLRFANAQPNAVDRVIQFADDPVTIDELDARLGALEPELVGFSKEESLWNTASREIRNLFTIREEKSSILTPEARVERARVMLTAGKIPQAIAEVERMPGAQAASRWIVDAKRYEEVQRALDLIETTAMLEPRRLQDSEGNQVNQPSPIAKPAESEEDADKSKPQ